MDPEESMPTENIDYPVNYWHVAVATSTLVIGLGLYFSVINLAYFYVWVRAVVSHSHT